MNTPQQPQQTTFSHPALCHLKSSEVVFCAIIFRALSGPAHSFQNCIVLQVWVSLLWGHCSFLLGPGRHKVLSVPSKTLSQLCKLWQLYGGVNGNLLQDSLCHTQVCCTQSPCSCRSPLPTCTSAGDTQTQFCLSLHGVSGSWCTRICLSPLSISGRYGFDSKHYFAPPTFLLGLLLCPWTWGISSQPLQCHTATAPALRSHCSSAHRLAGAPLPLDRLISSQLLQCRAAATAVPHSGTRI